jgi:hypothetical protein
MQQLRRLSKSRQLRAANSPAISPVISPVISPAAIMASPVRRTMQQRPVISPTFTSTSQSACSQQQLS